MRAAILLIYMSALCRYHIVSSVCFSLPEQGDEKREGSTFSPFSRMAVISGFRCQYDAPSGRGGEHVMHQINKKRVFSLFIMFLPVPEVSFSVLGVLFGILLVIFSDFSM